jgi:Kef-type K+ transport system membrane component KefB
MTPGDESALAQLVLLTGAILATALLVKAVLERLRIPALVGWLLLGFALRAAGDALPVLPEGTHTVMDFLAQLGVIVLLFSVGLASDPAALLGTLRRASPVWLSDVLVSGSLGLVAAHYGLGLGWAPSAVAAVALTATSVGVSSAVWERAGALGSADGRLFVDVAELDDLSGVLLLVLLFAVLPVASGQATGDIGSALLSSAAHVLAAIAGFGALCALLARFVTSPLMKALERFEPAPDPVVSVAALGILLAGLAGLLGFSVAIGAFFAGLAFSRASGRIREGAAYTTMRDLFVPFFFLGTALRIETSALFGAVWPALLLVAAAVAGKLLGPVPAARLATGTPRAWAIGWSMVPRAEIALVVAGRARELGDVVMPPELYSALVAVVALTCLGAPAVLGRLLDRGEGGAGG